MSLGLGYSFNRDRCPICRKHGREKWVSNSGFALASHNRMHARRGELVEISSAWTWQGERLNRRFVEPSDMPKWNKRGWFASFADYKAAEYPER